MGWKGAIRSYGAAVRRAERESVRNARELHKRQLQYEKMASAEAAKHDVEVYENFIEQITTLHKEQADPIDWQAITKQSIPTEPVNEYKRKQQAQYNLDHYKPGFFVRLFKLEEKMISNKKSDIEIANKLDEEEFKKNHDKYILELGTYTLETDFAKRVLNGDGNAYLDVLKELNSIEDFKFIGSQIKFSFINKDELEVSLCVHSEGTLPKNAKTLLKSGKVSEKPLPSTKFNQLYQDYVCSSILRVAREVLAALPIKSVFISAVDNLLDTSSGHLSEQAILSVMIPRETTNQINFEFIDPSDAMKKFKHNMNFKASDGFSPVEKLKAS